MKSLQLQFKPLFRNKPTKVWQGVSLLEQILRLTPQVSIAH